MDDLMILTDNRYSFLQWNAYELLLSLKGKCEDVSIADYFDKLLLLLKTEQTPVSEKREPTASGIGNRYSTRFLAHMLYL